MRKKMLSALLAVMTCTALLGTTVFATPFNGEMTTRGDQTVDGDSTVVNPIYSVVVPTTLVFGLDAFEQNGDSQVYSVDFPVINKSNVNVKVNVALKVEALAAANVVFKDSADDVAHTGSTKDVWFAAAVPVATTETTGTLANVTIGGVATDILHKVVSDSDATGIYVLGSNSTTAITNAEKVNATDFAAGKNPVATAVQQGPLTVSGTYAADASDYAVYTLDSTASDLTFALKKADYLEYYADPTTDPTAKTKLFDKMAATKAGSATYRFVGAINDAADWAVNDIKATAVYNFNGLSDANYTTLTTGDSQVAVGNSFAHALVKTATAPTATVTSGSYSLASPAIATVTVDYGTGNAAAAAGAVTLVKEDGTAVPTNIYSYNDSTKVLTINADAGILKFATAGSQVKLAVKFTDGKTVKFSVSVVQ